MTRVADNSAVLHDLEVIAIHHVDIASRCDKDIADRGSLNHRHDPEAIHDGLERLECIDLRHDDIGAHALGAHRDAPAAPSVPTDNHDFARDQHIGGADDAVQGRLARAVTIVKEVLGHCVVDGHDRVLQSAFRRHRPQANDTGRGLLGPADHVVQDLPAVLVHRADQIRTVVHRQMGFMIQSSVEVLVVGIVVLALDGVDRDLVIGDKRSSDIILRAQRVAGHQDQVSTAGDQSAREVARLRGDVQTRRHTNPLERLLFRHPLGDLAQHRHLALRPLHPQSPRRGQVKILHFMLHLHLSLVNPQ